MKAVHLIVSGRVQGVYFRAHTRETAQKLGLGGWVRNLDDGSVEIHAEGAQESLDKLVRWCRKGPPAAQVTGVAVDDAAPEGVKSFQIKY